MLLHYGPAADELSGPADFALLDTHGTVLFGGRSQWCFTASERNR